MSRTPFYDTYGISKYDLAELIHVDITSLRKYLKGEPVGEKTRKKIETAFSILDSDYFQFTPMVDDKSDYYVDRIARYEEEDRQKDQFTKIFEQWMYQGEDNAIREDKA